MPDWLLEGLTATISGVATVFIVLIIIAVLISMLKYVNRFERKGPITRQKVEAVQVVQHDNPKDEEDELALVAVITAAIASSLSVSTDQLLVRSIKPVNQNRRMWKRM